MWTNCPAREPLAISGRIRLEPLARQDLATVDELGRGEPHDHAVGRPSGPSVLVPVLGVLVGGDGLGVDVGVSIDLRGIDVEAAASAPPVPFVASASSGATVGYASARASARSPKTSVGS